MCTHFVTTRTLTPNFSSLSSLVRPWSSIKVFADSAGGGVGGSRGKKGRARSGIGSPKGEMPVFAFIQEPVNRLSRNLVCSTGIPVTSPSLSFILLARVVCAWRPREKYRARAAYPKNDPIWTKIDTQLVLTITHPHTKFQPSIFNGSPVVVDQSFRGISGRRSRRLAGEEGPGPVGHRLAEGGKCLSARLFENPSSDCHEIWYVARAYQWQVAV